MTRDASEGDLTAAKPCTIYDTNIVLQATLNPNGPAERALQVLDRGEVDAVMSNRLRHEYEAILTRPSLQAKYPDLKQPLVVEGQLERIDAQVLRVNNSPERILFPRDANDAHLVNLAIERQVDFLVSRDADLLDLNDDPTFRHLCPHTRIVDPVEFVREMDRRRTLKQDRESEDKPERAAKRDQRDRDFGMER